MVVKRGRYTETHTKREAVSTVSRPGIAGALFQNALKQRVSKKTIKKQHIQKFATVKQMLFSLFLRFLHYRTRILTKNAIFYAKH